MRLIDADKIYWEYKCISKEEIDDEPTVQAIPIEYIEKFKKKVRHIAPAKEVVDWLLENWEKKKCQ